MPIYLKYGSITGAVKETAHRGWIELESAQFPYQNSQYGTGTGARSPRNTNEIAVTKKQDSTSTTLFTESLKGVGVFATIEFVKDGEAYLRVEMTGTLITSYSVSGGGARPMESMSLNFEKVEFRPIPGIPAE